MSKLIFDKKTTYLTTIAGLPGTRIFQKCYFLNEKGRLVDVCEGGRLSCALTVSGVLYRFGLIKQMRVTVKSLIRDMKWSGWQEKEIDRLLPGAVLVWEPRLGADGKQHRHIGFFLGEDKCVSNDPRTRQEGGTFLPIEHTLYMEDLLGYKRKIEKAFCFKF